MGAQQVPVNRTLVGVLALGCWGCAGLLAATGWEGTTDLWQGAFLRVGVVMAAFWLALPTRTREAAWANVSIWTVVGVLAGLLVVARVRIPLKFLVPVLAAAAAAILVLRPRPKTRPKSHS